MPCGSKKSKVKVPWHMKPALKDIKKAKKKRP